MPLRRLDQLLANLGYCSRSEAKAWVKAGRVTVAGVIAKSSDTKTEPANVLVDGEPLEHPEGILALLHKPAGYVCSHDEREGPNVYALLPPRWLRRNPAVTTIGRLDKDTTGVLLITDDGELVHRWTSPKHKVDKVYEVTVDAPLRADLIPVFAAGTLMLEDETKPCLPARLEIVDEHHARLTLEEGRYHQVKRMFATQGYQVSALHRSRFGEFELNGLKLGEWTLVEERRFLRA